MVKVLCIDPYPDSLELEKLYLQEYFEVVPCLTADLTMIRAHRPDVILIDASPVDGGELIQELRADPELRHIPVVAVTGWVLQGFRRRYLALGFHGYVAKPITNERDLIDSVLDCCPEKDPD